MVFEKFKDQFHQSWWNKIQTFIESKECDEIYRFLKEESKRGIRITPDSSLTFRAFKETPLDEVKLLMLGYCPYHQIYNGVPIADGLAFSCSVTNKLQPSLITMYDGLENALNNGLNLEYYRNPDLTYLAKQGVLLLNSSLTCAKDKAGSHQSLWEPFTKYVLENIMAYTGIPILFIGKDASMYKRYVTPLTHGQMFEVEHPSFAARNQQLWNVGTTFQKINKVIESNKKSPIEWLCSQERAEKIIKLDFLPF